MRNWLRLSQPTHKRSTVMTAQLIDGKKIATQIEQELKSKVNALILSEQRVPGLAVILVGQDPASAVYVGAKRRSCTNIGYKSISHDLPVTTSMAELLAIIDDCNNDPTIDGILVQSPLPPQIDEQKVIERIRPDKDVDGFHPYNLGRLAVRLPQLESCTPRGVITLLQTTGIDMAGKHAVVIGSSNHVGRPMALELLIQKCTVTICHRHTQNLEQLTKQADILVVAIGNPKIVNPDWIKLGSVVIDIGINRSANGQIIGDVDSVIARQRAGWITPVPGGVGPMTVATLMQNTFKAAIELHGLKEH